MNAFKTIFRFHRRFPAVLVAGMIFLAPPMSMAEEAKVGTPMTLEEAYKLALKRSEELAVRTEAIREAEARFSQALGSVLPHASFISQDTYQEELPAGGTGLTSSFTQSHIPSRRFHFSQPLFSGFKEFAAMSASGAERKQREHERARAEQVLLVDVADAFHFLLERREDLAVLESIRKSLLERIDELTERERLGRSRSSEVASAEAQLRRTEAVLERAQGDEAVARQLLEFLTGVEPMGPIIDKDSSLPALEPAEAYVAKAKQRPDVLAAKEAHSFATSRVTVERAGFFPSVDLEGNQYVERTGISEEIDWDVLLTVDVPLFQGGEVLGRVREAGSQAEQARLRYEEALRSGRLDIRNNYTDLVASLRTVDALRRVVDATERNYKLQSEDYKHNLVSNLDVLQALRELEEARREYIRAEHESKRFFWRLRAAIGETI